MWFGPCQLSFWVHFSSVGMLCATFESTFTFLPKWVLKTVHMGRITITGCILEVFKGPSWVAPGNSCWTLYTKRCLSSIKFLWNATCVVTSNVNYQKPLTSLDGRRILAPTRWPTLFVVSKVRKPRTLPQYFKHLFLVKLWFDMDLYRWKGGSLCYQLL